VKEKIFINESSISVFYTDSTKTGFYIGGKGGKNVIASLFKNRNNIFCEFFVVNCHRIPKKFFHLEICVLLLYQKCYRIQNVCCKKSERYFSNVLW